jgi:murein DD-endopeptidase MepM/ murein hydrolase activator NlpD
MKKRFRILAYPFSPPSSRSKLKAGVAILAMLIGGVSAFGTAPSTVTYPGEFQEIVESLVAPAPETAELAKSGNAYSREVKIRQGDTLPSLLARIGANDGAALSFIQNDQEAAILFRQIVPGKVLTAQVTPQGSLQSLVFPLNGDRDASLTILRTPEGFTARAQETAYEKSVVLQTAVIRHSLFGAADTAGIPDSVASQLADIFGGDIDFHRDLRKGDRFSVIYEMVSHMGKSIRIDRILAAEFINDNKTYRAFWFRDNSGASGYYDTDGRSLRKAFLRSPLEFSRITSGFSSARYHPVLKETRAHKGIDYGAPTGTRVRATGDGTIEFSGIQGGYGKVVMIRHAGDKTTVYGHLSAIPSEIKMGQRVSQGDIIGYVGATGIATGPHLHYEFRVSGVHRNPLTVALPETAPMPQASLPAFRSHAESLMTQMETIRNVQLVMLD